VRPRLGFKEQRELDALPAQIAALEAEQQQLGARLTDTSTYQGASGASTLKAMNERFAAIEEALLACLERWESLEARRR
jgi:ATP-binding cassette subfamily F protein uup